MKVVVLHPDFGIGGAERLVMDVAQAFKALKHDVYIVTNHFSPHHCFNDMLSFKNIKVINCFPRNIFGKCYALCAYIRMCIAALYICINHYDTDIIFCDQISAALFIFRVFSKAKLLFYCHYPDQLLTTRKSIGKILYRSVIDKIECLTTGLADVLFVNSFFTESVFRSTFPSLSSKPIKVLYPCLNTDYIDHEVLKIINATDHAIFEKQNLKQKSDSILKFLSSNYEHVFLSLNRFEVKKNIELVVSAFGIMRDVMSQEEFEKCALILAGGYDVLNSENIAYHNHLKKIAIDSNLQKQIYFVLSPDDNLKFWLYMKATLVIYTPLNEHFGIVPLEAMYLKCPVLATNSGGPLETIVDGKTGFLQANEPVAFSKIMLMATHKKKELKKMGQNGHLRVLEKFSFSSFMKKLNETVTVQNTQKLS